MDPSKINSKVQPSYNIDSLYHIHLHQFLVHTGYCKSNQIKENTTRSANSIMASPRHWTVEYKILLTRAFGADP